MMWEVQEFYNRGYGGMRVHLSHTVSYYRLSRTQFYPFATKYVMTLSGSGYSPSTQVFLLDYSLSF